MHYVLLNQFSKLFIKVKFIALKVLVTTSLHCTAGISRRSVDAEKEEPLAEFRHNFCLH